MFWSYVKAHETHNFWALNDEEEEEEKKKKKKRARFYKYFPLTGRKYLINSKNGSASSDHQHQFYNKWTKKENKLLREEMDNW